MTHKPTPQSFPVDHQSQMIRRLPSNHPLMIEVDARGRQAVLRDLGSLNGCFINNVRIRNQREVLSHGDNVRFGFDSRVWAVDCIGGQARVSYIYIYIYIYIHTYIYIYIHPHSLQMSHSHSPHVPNCIFPYIPHPMISLHFPRPDKATARRLSRRCSMELCQGGSFGHHAAARSAQTRAAAGALEWR